MGSGWCSLVVLCVGAVSALSAMALVSIALTTDHWTLTKVDRGQVYSQEFQDSMEPRYFTRSRGLFRTCFPDSERPAVETPGLFLSPVEDWCLSRDYRLDSLLRGAWTPGDLSSQGVVRLHLARSTPALLALYLFIMITTGILGLNGCWNQSANKLITTAAFQLVSALVGATAMATWHAALFLEMEKVHDPGFPLTWPSWLQSSTSVSTSWSYMLAWAGVVLTLGASLATSAAAICLRAKARDWEDSALRMKLKMSSMFAGHAFYPGDTRMGSVASSPLPEYPGNHYHYQHNNPKYQDSKYHHTKYQALASPTPRPHTPEQSTFVDYRKVVGELENSKF